MTTDRKTLIYQLKTMKKMIDDKVDETMSKKSGWEFDTPKDKELMRQYIDNKSFPELTLHLIKVFGLESDIKNELGITDIRKLLLGIKQKIEQRGQIKDYVKTIETGSTEHLYENKPIKGLIDEMIDTWKNVYEIKYGGDK